jgi:two-component system sensor histidine kinase UhpB
MPQGKLPGINIQSLWHGSTLQLLGVIILPLALLVLVFALGSTWLHQHAMRDIVGERDELAVRAAAGALSMEAQHHIDAIRGLALRANDSDDIDKQTLASYEFLAPDFDLGLAVFSAKGSLLAGKAGGNGLDWEKLASQPDFTGLIQRSTKSGEIVEWTFDDSPAILVSASSPTGQVVAVGGISARSLAGHIVSNVLPDERETRVFIVNSQRTVVYQRGSSGNAMDLATHPGVNEALQGLSGTFYMYDRGLEHVVSYSGVPSLQWALVMEEPWQAVATPMLTNTQVGPLVLVPLLLITLGALWFGARQIVRPLRDLEKKAAQLAWGDPGAIEEPVGGITEIRQLQSELAHMARKVKAAQRSLRDYIGVITDAQEEERRRLARELHDDTLQSIIGLKQRVQLAHKNAPDEASRSSLRELETIAEQSIENLRRMTRALRPAYLEDLGLVTALEMLAREAEATSNVRVTFQKQGTEKRLAAPVELALYRMAQEALSNVARHAQASEVTLGINFDHDKIEMQVIDNGAGFEAPNTPTDFAPSGHFGLLGMYERADLIGARLTIRSTPGKGTHLTIQLPQT